MRYVAFDLDGVLVDMDEAHRVALNRALSICGPQAVLTMEEHLTTFKGLPTRVKLERLVAAGRVPASQVATVNAFKQECTVEEILKLRPDPAKIMLLEILQRNGWQLCVCSNAVRRSVTEMLLAGGLMRYVAFYLSNQDAAPKPAPDMYIKAAELFGVLPGRLVVVEDSLPGRQSAREAGCRLVGVDGPDEVVPELYWRIAATAEETQQETQQEERTWRETLGCSSSVGGATPSCGS